MAEEKLDLEKVRQIRQMEATHGTKKAQQRYGEDVTKTPEYQKAQRQRSNIRDRQRKLIADAADEKPKGGKTMAELKSPAQQRGQQAKNQAAQQRARQFQQKQAQQKARQGQSLSR